MEKKSRRSRLTAAGADRSSRGAARASVPAGATTIHDLADELLELIVLRVRSHRCLVRAAAACRPWRRVIAAHGFLRRFRSVQAPLVLGHFYAGARTAFVPAHTQPGKAAGGVSSIVSLDFLVPNFGGISDLFLSDSRGGLLAFIRSDSSVVVCDPWTKQNKVLVPPSTQGRRFFYDADEIGTARVLFLCICFDYEQNSWLKAQVSVFSGTDDDHWLLLDKVIVENGFFMALLTLGVSGWNWRKVCVGRVGGSIFWSVRGFHVFQVNESTGAFSIFYMPPGTVIVDWNNFDYERRKLRVVGSDARAARVVRIVGKELQVFQLVDGGGMCVEEKRVDLSQLCNIEVGPDRSWHFLELSETVAPGCIVLSPDDEKCHLDVLC